MEASGVRRFVVVVMPGGRRWRMKLRDLIFTCKHEVERMYRKWGEFKNSQSPPPVTDFLQTVPSAHAVPPTGDQVFT